MDNNQDIKRYTVSIFTENQIGLLSQISNIFTRRSLSIWSLYACATTLEGIHTITIVTDGTEKRITEVIFQLEKRVDVIKAFYYEGDLSLSEELAISLDKCPEVKAFLEMRGEEKKRVLEEKK
ncbi:MAG: acetolactate synthase small subunit [Bacteroidales bacterium]|nr:acetolactate synthase small subunit [Bacteroidales bacterium]